MMVGQIKADPTTGLYYYSEEIYDQFKFGALVVKTVAQCSCLAISRSEDRALF
jgi:hypothetical protein